MLLFFGFGVVSGLNPTSLGALAFGSFAVASAIFLILELNQPFSGLFGFRPHRSSRPLRRLTHRQTDRLKLRPIPRKRPARDRVLRPT
jgi:hypothetical protein